MPEIRCFVDQNIGKMLEKLEKEYKLGDRCEIIVVAVSLLFRIIEYCRENNINEKDCYDKCIRFILENY